MLKHFVLLALLAALLLVPPAAAANASVIENTEFITVQSSPPYADVYIDGVYQGKTPVTSPDYYEGYYEVRVVLAGYDEYVVPDLYVKPLGSGVASVTANLVKNTSIAGVIVYSEPVYAGTVPELKNGGLQLAGYLPGKHNFRFEKDGYNTVTKNNYMLTAGNTETLRVTLNKATVTETVTPTEMTTVPTETVTTNPTTSTPTAPPTKAPVPVLGALLGCAAAVLLIRKN